MQKKVLILILIFLSSCTSEFMEKYEYAKKRGERQGIYSVLKQEVGLHPGNGQAWLYLAHLYAEDQDWSEFVQAIDNTKRCGVPFIEKAEDLYKYYLNTQLNRGIEYYNNKQYELAISHLNSVLVIDPENPEAILLLAESKFQTNDWENAKPLFEILLQKNNSKIRALTFLTHIAMKTHNYSEVQKYGERVLKIKPGNQIIRRMVAFSYEKNGDNLNAIKHYSVLIKNSTYTEDYKALAVLYYRNGKVDSAIDVYKRLEKISKDKVPVFRALAQCFIVSQQYEKLIEVAKKLQKITREEEEAKKLLIMAYTILGKEDELVAITHQEIKNEK